MVEEGLSVAPMARNVVIITKCFLARKTMQERGVGSITVLAAWLKHYCCL